MNRVAEHLPAALTNWVYLERWLHGDSSRIDLILRVDERGREILAGQYPISSSVSEALRSRASWKRLEVLAREWMSNPLLHRDVAAFWLEFDLEEQCPDASVIDRSGPRVFVDFRPTAYMQDSFDERLKLAAETVRSIIGKTPGRPIQDELRRILQCLPRGAHLVYLGTSSAADTVRACVLGLTDEQLPRYLEAIGWPGDLRTLTDRVLMPLRDVKRDAGNRAGILHVDFGSMLLPRIGLEYSFDWRLQLKGQSRERAFFERLVEQGLCDPIDWNDFLAWPGSSVELLAHQVWYSRVIRRLNHVKVTCESGHSPTVKAYFCFSHELIRSPSPWPSLSRERERCLDSIE